MAYKKFHEIEIAHRLAILVFLCQTRLDAETPEMMQILAEQKKSTLVSLNAQIRLKKRAGPIEKGDIFFIQEFNDG